MTQEIKTNPFADVYDFSNKGTIPITFPPILLFAHSNYVLKLCFAARGRGTSSSSVQRDNTRQSVCIFCQQVGHSSNDCPSQVVGSRSGRRRQSGKAWFSVVYCFFGVQQVWRWEIEPSIFREEGQLNYCWAKFTLTSIVVNGQLIHFKYVLVVFIFIF